MKLARLLALAVLLCCAGCVDSGVRVIGRDADRLRVRTAGQAQDVVRSYIRDHGGDPSKADIHVRWYLGEWQLIAWYLDDPRNRGGQNNGAFTSYDVSVFGEVLAVRPMKGRGQGADRARRY